MKEELKTELNELNNLLTQHRIVNIIVLDVAWKAYTKFFKNIKLTDGKKGRKKTIIYKMNDESLFEFVKADKTLFINSFPMLDELPIPLDDSWIKFIMKQTFKINVKTIINN